MPDLLTMVPLAILDAVEALPASERGSLVVSAGGSEVGAILVEDNRVCWASALGLETRLRELLQEHSGWRIDDKGMERVVQVSRGRAFLTELTAKGLVSRPGIEAALRQHSIESLVALCGLDDADIRWVSREKSLDAPTSFEPAELLAAVGARLYASEAETARTGTIRPIGASGASYAIGDDDALVVVGEMSGEKLGIPSLLELGSWAAAALDATPGFTPAMVERALASADNSVAIAWRSSRRVLHALVVEERPALEHTVDTMQQKRVPMVLSLCVPWKLKQQPQRLAQEPREREREHEHEHVQQHHSMIRGAPGATGTI